MTVTINGTTGIAGVDGSAGTPAIQGGDTNTGVFFPAADTAAIATGGTERMRLDSSGNLQFNSGYGSVATAYGCRAWVNFNGTGTVAIRASGNVTSITDSGAGRYTVNFTTAMPDANYATQVTIVYSILLPATLTAATTSIGVTVDTTAGVPTDTSVVSVSVFR